MNTRDLLHVRWHARSGKHTIGFAIRLKTVRANRRPLKDQGSVGTRLSRRADPSPGPDTGGKHRFAAEAKGGDHLPASGDG